MAKNFEDAGRKSYKNPERDPNWFLRSRTSSEIARMEKKSIQDRVQQLSYQDSERLIEEMDQEREPPDPFIRNLKRNINTYEGAITKFIHDHDLNNVEIYKLYFDLSVHISEDTREKLNYLSLDDETN